MILPLGLLLLLSQSPAPSADPPPCLPHVFLWRVEATESELHGDLVYLSIVPKDLDGRFLGTFVLAGDPDAPSIQTFVKLRGTIATVTVCGHE